MELKVLIILLKGSDSFTRYLFRIWGCFLPATRIYSVRFTIMAIERSALSVDTHWYGCFTSQINRLSHWQGIISVYYPHSLTINMPFSVDLIVMIFFIHVLVALLPE